MHLKETANCSVKSRSDMDKNGSKSATQRSRQENKVAGTKAAVVLGTEK